MARKPKIQILLVEDDLNLGFLTSEFLESEDFAVKLCRDGESGIKAFMEQSFQICILDIMLPKIDGYQVAKELRKINPKIPILFLTAKNLKEDKHKGFELGADDYLTKPFDEDELLWRIQAILKRVAQAPNPSPDPIQIGKFHFEPSNQLLKLGTKEQRLTERESKVFELLCLNRGNLVRREDLLQTIWGENDYFAGRSLDVFITKLRKYLKDDPSVVIENVPRVGFLLSATHQ
ncbi:MAG TPA: DNA-binding response regulator [Marinilabiliales bacterium]|jgi:DNA-binding response OmpR family regulator|nr:MAG: two-component system response regulator [Bacteroidetes bacterium GWA2_40_14]OFX60467.1 MAG: two-component system response regulator [Bacteroidetes bacterium GWC2_40_13]OFX75476.1 MAG: two-component system response regulator [Bacteroidetes bacterium GWD2_40_43]OFX93991.1 MAG: two-component system response regulator [Bacteroidetes bacterium GWE2_40_63]OFY19780.1 MAG: two-component system response regulator [Bacteroidetes bacterium GWF2_40_13]OFZ28191.1 MAG: two-component system response 